PRRIERRASQQVDVAITVPGGKDHAPAHPGPQGVVDLVACIALHGGIQRGRHQPQELAVEGIERRQYLHGAPPRGNYSIHMAKQCSTKPRALLPLRPDPRRPVKAPAQSAPAGSRRKRVRLLDKPHKRRATMARACFNMLALLALLTVSDAALACEAATR